MKQYIGCDSHKRYSVFVTMDEMGRTGPAERIEHDSIEFRRYLEGLPSGAPVAVEASGGWYWLVDELEKAGLDPRLVNPLEARKRMPGKHKTDPIDARGLAMLLRNGTLPEVWIPPARLLDLRGLLRARLSLRQQGTLLKNRIHAALARYGIRPEKPRQDLFTGKGRVQLSVSVGRLPLETRLATLHEWELLDQTEAHIQELEQRMRERIGTIGWVRLLKSLPGVGSILGATIYLEIGDVKRFASAAHLASYAGLVPTIHSSGGKHWQGRTAQAANHYLKWAFIEAANCIVTKKEKWASQHVVQLYQRLKAHKCHGKAATAVARHLAESSWWILTKKQVYREPAPLTVSSSKNG